MAETEKPKVVTTRTIIQSKKNGTKIAALTAYDAIVAHILDESGIDIILVGDSLSNVVQGNSTTIPVSSRGDDLSCEDRRPGGEAGSRRCRHALHEFPG